jgi:hydroxyacylglutathione hydrolase
VASTAIELSEDVWQFQTRLWQTNSVLATTPGGALVCDPCWTPAEIVAIRDAALARGEAGHLLVTHADYDHTCGIGSFEDATVVAGSGTAEAIASGTAGKALEAAAAEWGLSWEGQPRVDRVVEPGSEVTCGPFRVATIDARGHTADGLAYVLLEQGILLPGDYLSGMTYPLVGWSVAEMRRSYERLLQAIDAHDLTWVVPGHGPALSRREARRIGEEDVAYLEGLVAAAREASSDGLSPGDSLLAVYAVEPPRPTSDDFEIFAIRALNARKALAEVESDR